MKKLLFASILAAVMAFTFAGCSETTTPTTTIVTTAQLQEQLVVLESKLITLENKINAAVQPSEVSAIKADIAGLKSQIAGITTGVTQSQLTSAVNAAIAGMQVKIDALQAEIVALTAVDPTVPPVETGYVTATVQHYYPFPFTLVAGSNASTTYRVTVTNGTSVAKNDVRLQTLFQGSAPFAVTGTPTLAAQTAIGSTSLISWMYSGQYLISNNALLFGNSLGLNLAAGETKTFDLILTVNGDTAVSMTTQMFVVS